MEVRAVYRNISETIIGLLYKEDEEFIYLKAAAVVSVKSSKPGDYQVQFPPIDLLSLEPVPVSLKAILSPDTDFNEYYIKLHKKSLLMDNLQLSPELINGYKNEKFVKRFLPKEDVPEFNLY